MSIGLESFEDSLRSLNVECVRVEPDAVAEAIVEVATEPAVGIPLERGGVRLPDSVSVDPAPAELDRAETGVTPASFAVANYGSVALPSRDDGSELVALYVDHHVVIVDERDVVADMEAAFDRFDGMARDGDDDVILATGPSATADMGELVRGAHGPSDVTVVLVED
jgi:L-lactate dehydrogenase complex protein LldG